MVRAEKGTPNYNASRTLTAGCIITLVILMGADPLQRLWDQHVHGVWVDPLIDVRPQTRGKPVIYYGARPTIDAEGAWTTWLEVDGLRCCTNKGQGHYVAGRQPRLWDWETWFGRDWPVPDRPYAACVSYTLETTRSGARRQFGPFCSEIVGGME